MIVYRATKQEFQAVAHESDMGEVIRTAFEKATQRRVGESEVRSWSASLMHMSRVLNDPEIPNDAGVGIEFHVPPLKKRIDFLLSGHDLGGNSTVAIVELKQWSDAERTTKEDVVITRFQSGPGEVPHPSYQAWSYAELMRSYCEPVSVGDISVHPCAYLHNYPATGDLFDPHYAKCLALAPLFTKGDAEKERLRDFLKRHVAKGDSGTALYDIENGKICPSKALADAVVSMLDGNNEFILLDDQKVVFEAAKSLWDELLGGSDKQVLIIEGGPGTGKSVVAINLLVDAIKRRRHAGYVTKNAAPRAVFEHRLARSNRKDRAKLAGLFHGSGEFIDTKTNAWDVLVVDEAHRLREKSGLYGNLGDHQIGELIASARRVVFLIDERQRVTMEDIGTKAEIAKWAKAHKATVRVMQLTGQYRCAGSDAFMTWVERTLGMSSPESVVTGVAETRAKYAAGAATEMDEQYDLRVFDSPSKMREEIEALNRQGSARMVAGYCWPWASKKKSTAYDVEIPEHSFKMRWNLTKDGGLWMIANGAIEQIGCIHTCQGLEANYIGVVIGPDLVIRDGRVVTDFSKRDRYDKSLRGIKKLAKSDAERAHSISDKIIRNTYFTLMTRGMKGCFLYSTDAETQQWLRMAATEFRVRVGLSAA